MTHQPLEIFLDCIRFREGGRYWHMAPVDLHPLFKRRGVRLVTPTEPRGPLRPWRDRPWRACWEIRNDRLRLTGIWGDVAEFDFSGRPPVAPWMGDQGTEESRAFLEAHGYTLLWHQLFPDLMPGASVDADWCRQELCVVDSSRRFANVWGNHIANQRDHRMITIEDGRVVRVWRRRHGGPTLGDQFDLHDREGLADTRDLIFPEPPESPDS